MQNAGDERVADRRVVVQRRSKHIAAVAEREGFPAGNAKLKEKRVRRVGEGLTPGMAGGRQLVVGSVRSLSFSNTSYSLVIHHNGYLGFTIWLLFFRILLPVARFSGGLTVRGGCFIQQERLAWMGEPARSGPWTASNCDSSRRWLAIRGTLKP